VLITDPVPVCNIKYSVLFKTAGLYRYSNILFLILYGLITDPVPVCNIKYSVLFKTAGLYRYSNVLFLILNSTTVVQTTIYCAVPRLVFILIWSLLSGYSSNNDIICTDTVTNYTLSISLRAAQTRPCGYLTTKHR
jgi:hypothetical protein